MKRDFCSATAEEVKAFAEGLETRAIEHMEACLELIGWDEKETAHYRFGKGICCASLLLDYFGVVLADENERYAELYKKANEALR